MSVTIAKGILEIYVGPEINKGIDKTDLLQ